MGVFNDAVCNLYFSETSLEMIPVCRRRHDTVIFQSDVKAVRIKIFDAAHGDRHTWTGVNSAILYIYILTIAKIYAIFSVHGKT